jgi:DNA repair exonuclease SbcCD ATPase subunit
VALLDPFLKKIGLRQDKQEAQLTEARGDIEELREKVAAIEARLNEVETTVDEFDKRIDRQAQESQNLKSQTRRKLRELQEEHDALIKCLQMSIAKQVLPEREQRLNGLIKTARQRRTLITNEIHRRTVQ